MKKTIFSLISLFATTAIASPISLVHTNKAHRMLTQKVTRSAAAYSVNSWQESDPGYACHFDISYSPNDVCFGSSLTISQRQTVQYSCPVGSYIPKPFVCDGRMHYLPIGEKGERDYTMRFPSYFFLDSPGTMALGMDPDDTDDMPQFGPVDLAVNLGINNCHMQFNAKISNAGIQVEDKLKGKIFNCIGSNATEFTEVSF